MIWHWPQIAMAAGYALEIVLVAALHGEPLSGRHNVLSTILACASVAAILYCGGFWTGGVTP